MDVITVITISIFMAVVLLLWRRHRLKPIIAGAEKFEDPKSENTIDDTYSNIQPLDSFECEDAPVPLNATFKPKYHLTMGKTDLYHCKSSVLTHSGSRSRSWRAVGSGGNRSHVRKRHSASTRYHTPESNHGFAMHRCCRCRCFRAI